MTIKDLSKYYECTVLIKSIEQEICHLETCPVGTVANYSGTGSGGGGAKTDNVHSQAMRIEDQKQKLRMLLTRTEEERSKITHYIFDVVAERDRVVAAMMYQRFIKLKSWYGVARELGGNNTADSCRMAVFRFVQKDKERF